MNEDTLQLQAHFDRTLVRQHHKSVRYGPPHARTLAQGD